MKKKLVFGGTGLMNESVNVYLDSTGWFYVDAEPTGDPNKPGKLCKMKCNVPMTPGDPVDFDYEIVDDHDYYTSDCNFFDFYDCKAKCDMAYHFGVGAELVGCDQYENDEDMIATFRSNCEYWAESGGFDIITFYKQHGEHGEKTQFHVLACCPKEVADTYHIKADSYLD